MTDVQAVNGTGLVPMGSCPVVDASHALATELALGAIGDSQLFCDGRGNLQVEPKSVAFVIGEQVVGPFFRALASLWSKLPSFRFPGALAAPAKPVYEESYCLDDELCLSDEDLKKLNAYRRCMGPMIERVHEAEAYHFAVPDAKPSKPAPLTQEEWDLMLSCRLREGKTTVKLDQCLGWERVLQIYGYRHRGHKFIYCILIPVGLELFPFPLLGAFELQPAQPEPAGHQAAKSHRPASRRAGGIW